VDRRVLNDVIDKSGWAVSHYDVLPDRLVLYLWPQAGGTKLTFEFRPRYGLKARTAPSVLYDYYNPEAMVTLPPADFIVETNPLENLGNAVAASKNVQILDVGRPMCNVSRCYFVRSFGTSSHIMCEMSQLPSACFLRIAM